MTKVLRRGMNWISRRPFVNEIKHSAHMSLNKKCFLSQMPRSLAKKRCIEKMSEIFERRGGVFFKLRKL